MTLAGLAFAEQRLITWLVAEGVVVAGAMSYPRACSKDGVPCPHLYVELCCCSQPGRGYGSLMLIYLEALLAANSGRLASMLARSQALQPGAAAASGAEAHALAALRLLSVESAHGFYRKHGYIDASCHEMSKPVAALRSLPAHGECL